MKNKLSEMIIEIIFGIGILLGILSFFTSPLPFYQKAGLTGVILFLVGFIAIASKND